MINSFAGDSITIFNRINEDSLKDQEGGAMYISCDVSKGGPAEPEAGYVPNNPLFGLPLDSPQQECATSCIGCLSCQRSTPLPLPLLPVNDIDCGSCFDATVTGDATFFQGISQINLNSYSSEGNCTSSYWSPDEMASTFPGLPPLDIDPLPSLFQFSPCGTSYNFSANPHQASLSYIVHPHQALLSPSHHNQTAAIGQQPTTHNNTVGSLSQVYYYDTANLATTPTAPTTPTTPTGHSSCSSQHMSAVGPAAIYPSMSVNVSMNMTMHGYSTTDHSVPLQYSQWTTSNSSSYPPAMSPTPHFPNNASYPFTNDLRSSNTAQVCSNAADVLPPLSSDTIERNLTPLVSQPHSHDKKHFFVTTQETEDFPSSLTKSPTLFTQICDSRLLLNNAETAPESNIVSSDVPTYDDEEDSNEEVLDNKLNICRLCGKTYARPSTLKTHLRTHSGERPYRCHSCNKSFSQAANLTAHVRTHTGQKPFRCPICDRRFSQSSSVTTHMRTHSGERPYRCSSCKKSFSDSSTLTKHLRIHSGEKPYQCKLCLLRFSQSGNLNRHMRVHATNSNTSFVT